MKDDRFFILFKNINDILKKCSDNYPNRLLFVKPVKIGTGKAYQIHAVLSSKDFNGKKITKDDLVFDAARVKEGWCFYPKNQFLTQDILEIILKNWYNNISKEALLMLEGLL